MPDHLFVFFEGKDDKKYYNCRIKEYSKCEYLYFECGKKDEVLKTYNAIKLKQTMNILMQKYVILLIVILTNL